MIRRPFIYWPLSDEPPVQVKYCRACGAISTRELRGERVCPCCRQMYFETVGRAMRRQLPEQYVTYGAYEDPI